MSRTHLTLAGACLAVPFAVFAALTIAGCEQPTAPPPSAIPSGLKDGETGVTDKSGASGRAEKADGNSSSQPGQANDASSNGREKPPGASAAGQPSHGQPSAGHAAENPAPGGHGAGEHGAGEHGAGGHGTGHSVKPRALLNGWEKPAVAIVLSGEMHGYLEPCGCTELQSGGVSRRADLFRQLEKKEWPVAALDLGGLPRRERAQSRIKYDVIRKALTDMGYALQALGPEELRLGVDDLVAMAPDSRDPEAALPFVAANVVFYDTPDFGTPAHHRLVKAGGVTIGVTAVLDPALGRTIAPEGSAVSWKILPPEPEVKKALEELEPQKPDLLVLLSHGSMAAAKELAGEFPQFDLILSAGGPEDPDDKPVRTGKPMIVNVGHKGKHVGVVGYYPDNAKERLRYELVNLDKIRFHDTPKMHEHMREYQERLRQEEIVRNDPAIPHPSGHKFVGADKCGDCHTKSFAKWKTTGHANAFESILTGGHVYEKEGELPFIARAFDAECLACHTTGWHPQEVLRYDSGYLPPEFAKGDAEKERLVALRGNQCENCHGPGSHHVEWAEGKADRADPARTELRVTLAQARDNVCYKCHDTDNSPNFKASTFDQYWEKIRHPGLD